MMLTIARLRGIKPKRGRPTTSIPDGRVPGLAARYGARGIVEFSLVYRFGKDAAQYRQSIGFWWDHDLGPAPSDRWLSLDAARLKAMQLREQALAGTIMLPFVGMVPSTITHAAPDAVSAVLARYGREHLDGLKTGRQFGQLLHTACAAFLDKPIGEVTRQDIRAVLDRHMQAGRGHMANRVHATMSTFMHWAAGQDIIAVSPLTGMSRPMRREPSRDRVLSDAELGLVWHACEMLPPARRDAIRLLILTGMRRGEVCGLLWSDVGPEELTIPAVRMKTGVLHTVPLAPLALAIIQGQPRTQARVFANLSNLSSATTVREAMTIPGWRLHDFRRTFASGLQRLGVQPAVIDRCLAHSAIIRGTAAVYMRNEYLPERREAMEMWGRHVGKIIETIPCAVD
jgi:integrase